MNVLYGGLRKADIYIGGELHSDIDFDLYRRSFLFLTSTQDERKIQVACVSGYAENVLPIVLAAGLSQANDRYSLSVADGIIDALKQLDFLPESFLLDVTSFTPETTQILLAILVKNYPLAAVYCYFNPTFAATLSNMFFTDNAPQVRSVLGFPGMLSPINKTHLIVTTGLNPWLIHRMIDEFEPSALTLCWHEGSSMEYKGDVHGRVRYGVSALNMIDLSCDPHSVRESLLQEATSRSNSNAVIIVCGDNRYALGAAFAALDNQDIQLCCTPMKKLR